MNKLVQKYKDEKRWINYKIQTRGGKKTKVPYRIDDKMGSSTNPDDWETYEKAINASKNIGIVFTPDQKLLGIDIDKCFDGKNITHTEKENIARLIIEADTYTEVSISGTGFHLFLEITDSLSLVSHRTASLPYEVYTDGRYFTVSQNTYKEEKDVRAVTSKEALELLSIIGYPWGKETTSYQTSSSTLFLDDETVLSKMFASKKGDVLKSLYNGDTSNQKGDDSAADLALCNALSFWTARNANQIERIWLSSPLGKRKKTQERKPYRDGTIKKAIENCKEVYNTPKMKQEKELQNLDIDLLFSMSEKGEKIFIQNTENVCRILRKHPNYQGKLRYDSFTNNFDTFEKGKWRIIENNDAVHYQTSLSILYPFLSKVGKDMVYDAMIKVAKENAIDSAADYISSLRWDGTDRISSWLTQTYGTPNDIYHRAVGSNWLKGLVKRIIQPGCKFDYVLVLEGKQGSKKSTSLSVLGESWHVETTMSTDNKDFFMQFQGKAIVEFSEGETLSRTEVKRMKAIITMQTDKYRPPYEKTSQDFPRHCVFAMTTNQTEYLKDETGNRRWLPVTVMLPQANIEWLQANREQLFAEAYHRAINLKETVYEFPEEETLAAQAARRIHDPNTELIYEWYWNLSQEKRDDGITIQQVYQDALHKGFVNKPLDKWNEMNIAEVLKDVLKLDKERKMVKGVQCNRWYDKSGVRIEDTKLTTEEIFQDDAKW